MCVYKIVRITVLGSVCGVCFHVWMYDSHWSKSKGYKLIIISDEGNNAISIAIQRIKK